MLSEVENGAVLCASEAKCLVDADEGWVQTDRCLANKRLLLGLGNKRPDVIVDLDANARPSLGAQPSARL